jgi:hypothetical protein
MDTLRSQLKWHNRNIVEKLDSVIFASANMTLAAEEHLRTKKTRCSMEKIWKAFIATQPKFAQYVEAENDFERLVESVFEELS